MLDHDHDTTPDINSRGSAAHTGFCSLRVLRNDSSSSSRTSVYTARDPYVRPRGGFLFSHDSFALPGSCIRSFASFVCFPWLVAQPGSCECPLLPPRFSLLPPCRESGRVAKESDFVADAAASLWRQRGGVQPLSQRVLIVERICFTNHIDAGECRHL